MVRTLHFTPKWSPGVSLMVGGVEIFLTSDLITSIVYPLHTPPELKLLMDNLDNFFWTLGLISTSPTPSRTPRIGTSNGGLRFVFT